MANLVQIAEELEYMPKDQLAQMTQDPNSTYPQFLVLSEIQRRTQLERAYQAQAEGMGPQTTVAEETVAEFMGPQGLQGMAEQPMPQDMQQPMQPPMQQPMAESPMQMAANGGRTGFMQGGISTRGSLLNTMGIEHTGMTEQEMGNLIGGINREEDQAPRSFGLMDREIVPEISEPETDMMADGGRTGFLAGGNMPFGGLPDDISNLPGEDQDIPEDVMEEVQSVIASKGSDFLKFAGVLKQDGSIDPLGATLAVASLHPVGRAAGWAAKGTYALGKKYLPGIASGLKGIAQKGYNKAFTRPELIQGQGFTMQTGKNLFSPAKALATTTTAALPIGAVRNISNSAQEQYALDQKKAEAEAEAAKIAAEEEAARIAGLSTAGTATKPDTKKSGLFSNISQDQGLTIAQLGGVLMGAKNMSELGTGIAGVASQAQDRRSSAGLAGAQQSYYEAQAEQAKAEVAAMPEEQRIAKLKQYEAFADQLSEGEVSLTPDELAKFNATYLALLGIETQGDEDFLKGTKTG